MTEAMLECLGSTIGNKFNLFRWPNPLLSAGLNGVRRCSESSTTSSRSLVAHVATLSRRTSDFEALPVWTCRAAACAAVGERSDENMLFLRGGCGSEWWTSKNIMRWMVKKPVKNNKLGRVVSRETGHGKDLSRIFTLPRPAAAAHSAPRRPVLN